MDLGSIGSLKELSIRSGSVFYMRFYPEDNVVPKFAGDGHRDKYFVILGKDSDGLYIALSLINSEINSNLKSRIEVFTSIRLNKKIILSCKARTDLWIVIVSRRYRLVGFWNWENIKVC